MTAQRDWPNNAREARDRSAELALEIDALIAPVAEGKIITETALRYRAYEIRLKAREIERRMKEHGAQTKV